jgi:glutamine cyclotransferase
MQSVTRVRRSILIAVLYGLVAACVAPNYDCPATPQACTGLSTSAHYLPWRLSATVSHDRFSFTEGLVFVNGRLFESSGRSSRLLEVSPSSGAVLRNRWWPTGCDQPSFGEGLASDGSRLVQLSWQTKEAWTWDVRTLARGERLSYATEGWGLAFDGTSYLRSDGSSTIYRHAPASFEVIGSFEVSLGGAPIDHLNELEWIDGLLYANVLYTPYVVRIAPTTGAVTGVLDFSTLVSRENAHGAESVLNGLAWNSTTKRLYVTGKNWKHYYVVTIGDNPSPDMEQK